MTSCPRRAAQWLLLTAVLLLSGCASAPSGAPNDPFESTNRAVYRFNDDLDRAVLKPAAQTWREVVPEPARDGVANFFHNLSDLWSALNHVLQGRVVQGATNLARFGVNSVLGLFGLFDVATPMGFARADTDLGETLTTWGVASGPYVVLPFMGPSTVRGTTGQLLQWHTLHTMRLVDARARWLEASDLAASMALDPYSLVRDSYWQRMQAREAQLRAFAPPPSAR
ncbi:MAG: MlaA family lipoprotein [Burkholderiaceae bacterium]